MVKLVYDKGGCVGCPKEWGCLGASCPHCWETVMVCDECGEECDELFCHEGETSYQLCESCFDDTIIHITIDNAEDYIEEREDFADE